SLFLPWYGLSDVPERAVQGSWICGPGVFECSAWESFGFSRWIFVLAAVAPLLMAYFVATDELGKYPTGEATMTVGFAVVVLVFFYALVVVPGGGLEFGISLKWGLGLAAAAGILMAAAGALRSLEQGGGAKRKPPS